MTNETITPKGAAVFPSVTLTPKCTVIFPKVVTAEGFNGSKPCFSMDLLFSKETDMTPIKKAISDAIASKWSRGTKIDTNPLRDGDTARTKKGELKKEKYKFYENSWFVRVKSKTKPRCVGPDKRTIENEEITHGSECFVSFHAWGWPWGAEKGVSLDLHNIQKIGQGTLAASTSDPDDDFGVVDVDIDETGLMAAGDLGL